MILPQVQQQSTFTFILDFVIPVQKNIDIPTSQFSKIYNITIWSMQLILSHSVKNLTQFKSMTVKPSKNATGLEGEGRMTWLNNNNPYMSSAANGG
jgi:hypothetical protein